MDVACRIIGQPLWSVSARCFFDPQITQISQIWKCYGKAACQLWENTNLKLYVQDFTKAESPRNNNEKFNLIICNPPYVRHHHIVNQKKAFLQSKTELVCGIRMSGLSGLYCYFLCLSHGWMRVKGLAGWLIPSEFMDVNYGKAIKQYGIKISELDSFVAQTYLKNSISFEQNKDIHDKMNARLFDNSNSPNSMH